MDTMLLFWLAAFLVCYVQCSVDINFEHCSFKCGDNPVDKLDQVDRLLSEIRRNYSEKATCPQTGYLFPRRSTDYIRVKPPLAPINELSVCTWAKIYGTGTFWGTILSYSTPSDTNNFLVLFDYKGTQKLYISALGEVKHDIQHPLKKGPEHFICFVFGRSAGFLRVYYNGTLDTTLSFTNRNPIPSGGAFIIGQEQDSYLGGFEANQAIHGEIRNYMVWDRALTGDEISRMYRSKCDCAPGHVIALTSENVQLEGGVNALYEENNCH